MKILDYTNVFVIIVFRFDKKQTYWKQIWNKIFRNVFTPVGKRRKRHLGREPTTASTSGQVHRRWNQSGAGRSFSDASRMPRSAGQRAPVPELWGDAVRRADVNPGHVGECRIRRRACSALPGVHRMAFHLQVQYFKVEIQLKIGLVLFISP